MSFNRYKLRLRAGARQSGGNATPTPTPTPTSGALDTPILTKTSVAAANPIAFEVALNAAVGFYLRLQRTYVQTGGLPDWTAGTVVEEVNQITGEDWFYQQQGFNLLKDMPDGYVAVRAKIERDNGQESLWSSAVSDVLAAYPLDVIFNTNRRHAGVTVSNGGLKMTGQTSSNAAQGVLGSSSKIAGATLNSKGYYEILADTTIGSAGSRTVGLAAPGFPITTTNLPGASGQEGFSWKSDGNIYRNSGTISATDSMTWTDADVVGIYGDGDLPGGGRGWFQKNGTWLQVCGNPAYYFDGAVINTSTSSTTVTVTTAPTRGTIQVGAIFYNASTGARIGTVASLGTGSGGTGTYILAANALSTNSALSSHGGGLALNFTGAFLPHVSAFRDTPMIARFKDTSQQYRGSLQTWSK